jgi:preprotein translocase subunit SecY
MFRSIISSLVNVFRIPELRRKLLITLMLLAVYRVGIYVTIPGIDVNVLGQVIKKSTEATGQTDSASSRAVSIVDMFSGGALSHCGLFALGIMPYISASIIFQLLTTVIKPLEELSKEGEAGRKKINQYTRYATVGLCLVWGFTTARWVEGLKADDLSPVVHNPGMGFELASIVTLTAGTIFLMWLGEQIDEYGIGNGISLIIMAGIVARMPSAMFQMIRTKFEMTFRPAEGRFGLVMLLVLAAMYVAVVVAVIIIQQGQRRITVQTAKQTRGRRVYGGQQHYMPLRVNHAGVIPIIFAQSLLTFPGLLVRMVANRVSPADHPALARFMSGMASQLSIGAFGYVVVYVIMIFFFCFFWTAVAFNPVKMAEDWKQYGHFVPGIRPGKRTAEYLERLMTRITLAGAAFLAAVAILPQLFNKYLNLDWQMASIYGGTGLLIVVGVALDVVQKIESHLLMRHYDGFIKGHPVRGRR